MLKEIEVIEPMTKNEAVQWQLEVETTGRKLGELLYEGYKRDAWRQLGYGSWTQCVRDLAERSGFKDRHAFRLLEHERLVNDVLHDNKVLPNWTVNEKRVPENERLKQDVLLPEVAIATNIPEGQTRPLSKLETDNEKKEVWKRAVETAPGEKMTAKHVENTVKEYREAKTEAPKSKSKDYITLSEWNELSQVERDNILAKDYSNSSTFNKTNDNIEWARWSWNPVTGCLHNCAYCYARDIAIRFFPQNFEPCFLPARLQAPKNTKHPDLVKISDPIEKLGQQNVFVCSMADLFGKWVPTKWIEATLESITNNPQWTFLLLSKFPVRMAEFDYPDNVWLGTSCDYQHTVKRAESAFIKIKNSGFNGTCWLSCEPMMENLQFNSLSMFDWVVMGGASSSTQTPKFLPPFDWIVNLYVQARKAHCKVYQKTNLIPEMSDSQRVREYPI
jgi:protein gp37